MPLHICPSLQPQGEGEAAGQSFPSAVAAGGAACDSCGAVHGPPPKTPADCTGGPQGRVGAPLPEPILCGCAGAGAEVTRKSEDALAWALGIHGLPVSLFSGCTSACDGIAASGMGEAKLNPGDASEVLTPGSAAGCCAGEAPEKLALRSALLGKAD
mmetsp:Transcript_51128/g.119781  ORF Transcript_51128/g.119781 Transcript_51128/m.119781 type:complete len:157 (+) Transcript_51128:51-521(+)